LKIAKGYPEAVKKEGQCNDQKKKEKNNDITHQTKERTTGTIHNTKVELW
jgi:hypothetical protein